MDNTQTQTKTDLMCGSCKGKGNYVGTDITCRSCHGMGLETDLVKIARWEVIEAAKRWAVKFRGATCRIGSMETVEDNLLAAVALLESREVSTKPTPENVPSVDSELNSPVSYRIEKRSDEGPTKYWSWIINEAGWLTHPDNADI